MTLDEQLPYSRTAQRGREVYKVLERGAEEGDAEGAV